MVEGWLEENKDHLGEGRGGVDDDGNDDDGWNGSESEPEPEQDTF